MGSFEKSIQFEGPTKNQGSFDRATNGFPDIENKDEAFEPQIAFPNQPLASDSYSGYMKIETTKVLMFSTLIRYLVLFKFFLSLIFLACLELILAFFIPIAFLEFIGYWSCKALNRYWSKVYLVFLIINFSAKLIGFEFVVYSLFDRRWINQCWIGNNGQYDYNVCSYYVSAYALLRLLISIPLILAYEIFQLIIQFKFVKTLKNLTEENKKAVLEMINSNDISLCFCYTQTK